MLPTLTRIAWKHIARDWLPAVAWMALLFVSSHQPNLPGPGAEGSATRDVFNYSAHAAAYAVLAGLLWRALSGDRNGARAIPVRAGLLAALYAASDEFHQHFIPGRTMSVWDWLADVFGVALALAMLHLVRLHRRPRSRPAPVIPEV